MDLTAVVDALRSNTEFLAGRLASDSDQHLMEQLGLPRDGLNKLLLCKTPKNSAEIEQIAGFVGIVPDQLSAVLSSGNAELAVGSRAAEMIAEIHQMGSDLGYIKVRIDRGQMPNRGAWYEVGYGCGEILVRTSTGGRWRTARPLDDLARLEIQSLLESNKSRSRT